MRSQNTTEPVPVQGSPRLRWEGSDRYRVWTWTAMAGLLGGALMAVFGLPPVDLHGPLNHVGVMTPTCGITRGVRYTLLGQWAQAWRYNPGSLVLVAGATLLVLRHLVGKAAGRWVSIHLRWNRLTWTLAIIVIPALWINQQLHAQLLMAGT